MEGWLHLLMRQAFEHQAHPAQVDPRLAGGGQELVIFAHPPIPSDPSERALYHPAPRLGLEAREPGGRLRVRPQPLSASARPLDELHPPAQGLPDPGLQRPPLGVVGPDQLQAGQARRERREELAGPRSVLPVGRMHPHARHQAERVDEPVALAS